MTTYVSTLTSIALLSTMLACSSPADTATPAIEGTTGQNDVASGGTTTSYDATSKAYSVPLANISADLLTQHQAGDAVFEATFVTAPSVINPGLGPLFNNVSCRSCHLNDGRAQPPVGDEPFNGLLFRCSAPGTDAHGGPNPLPGFGLQVQTRGVFGVQPEMDVQITRTPVTGQFSDGTTYTLQRPTYTVVNPYIPLPAGAMISPRIAQPNFGLGLLEAIPDATIMALADENDTNGDGISGKVNMAYDNASQTMKLGRFGWKASQPTLVQQAAAALHGDIGITSPYFPFEESDGQPQAIPAHDVEISAGQLDRLHVYLQTLAPPARRNATDKTVAQGKTLFYSAKCTACHLPVLQTGPSPISALSNQTIRPYTDLLVHDMGPDLSDNRPDYRATGSEWRTAPLWGIGLTKIVNGHTTFLHDGRANSLLEAILWHGGEAAAAEEAVRKMSAADRNALVKFLESL